MEMFVDARRNATLLIWAASFVLVVCELETVLWLRDLKGAESRDFVSYLIPFLLLLPLLIGWMTRKRVVKWETQSEISAAVAAKVNSVTGTLVFLGYLLFLLSKDLK
ncbi:MAG: hypothetical protein WBX19_21755 [Terracidiphilus sp.]